MIGASHKTASLAVLERLAVRDHNRPQLISSLRAAGCDEAVVLSTCSRTEVYMVMGGAGVTAVVDVLARTSGLSRGELGESIKIREGEDAVRHLFRVAAGLDSRIVGEVDVQDQVRGARVEAAHEGTVGPQLQRLFVAAVVVARRIHSETILGRGGRSIGRRAAEIGMADVAATDDPAVAIMGSGRMATVVAERLNELGAHPVSFARNRTKAARLVGDEARVYPIESLHESLAGIDVLFCATSASDQLVRAEDVRGTVALRHGRPLTIIDLSVPRNVESAVGSIRGVRLIDLEGIEEHHEGQALTGAVSCGEMIAAEESVLFTASRRERGAAPVIVAMRERVEQVCLEELARVGRDGGLGPEEMRRAANAIAGKLLHAPIVAARKAAAENDSAALEQLCRLFRIEPSADSPPIALGAVLDRRWSSVPAEQFCVEGVA